MTFDEFLSQAWSDHANDSEGVASRLEEGKTLLNENEQIPALAGLVTHVLGEHLGLWNEGIYFLTGLKSAPIYESGSESERSIDRSVAALSLASGNSEAAKSLSTSDQIRALSSAACALSEQRESEQASAVFNQALELANNDLEKNDPANRALAIAGNNLASALEERPSLSPREVDLMILAAKAGRKFWEISGTWLEVERAEYRLSHSYLKARDLDAALMHAQACIEIAIENRAPALELFFGFEGLAKVEKAYNNREGFIKALGRAKEYFKLLSLEDREWCSETLKGLQ